MIIIKDTPEYNGAHANQTWDGSIAPNGYIEIPEHLLPTWEQYKPFVSITIEDSAITSMVDNLAARQAQAAIDANQPPATLTPEEKIAELQAQNEILSNTLDSLMTEVLPMLMGL